MALDDDIRVNGHVSIVTNIVASNPRGLKERKRERQLHQFHSDTLCPFSLTIRTCALHVDQG
jgi:hypothetical protein